METTKRTNIYDAAGQRGAANLRRVELGIAFDRCAYCGRIDCTVGGMHGMLRERAAAAKRQIAAEK